jgi:hypothetical protein
VKDGDRNPARTRSEAKVLFQVPFPLR